MPVLPANPWDGLSPDEPLVLPSDRLAVESYNECENARAYPRVNRLIHTNLMPEPFFGPFDAPVVVLLLNPGVSEQDAQAHANPAPAHTPAGESAARHTGRMAPAPCASRR